MTPSPAIRACSEALRTSLPSRRGLAIAITAKEYGRTATVMGQQMAARRKSIAEARQEWTAKQRERFAGYWYADRD